MQIELIPRRYTDISMYHNGFCEMRVRDTGAIVYRFAEFEATDGTETEI